MARRGPALTFRVLLAASLVARLTASEADHPPHTEADTGGAHLGDLYIGTGPGLLFQMVGSFSVDAVIAAAR
jgi:hypothetical protein